MRIEGKGTCGDECVREESFEGIADGTAELSQAGDWSEMQGHATVLQTVSCAQAFTPVLLPVLSRSFLSCRRTFCPGGGPAAPVSGGGGLHDVPQQ